MGEDSTTAIERFARTQHSTAARWLQTSFRAKLTAEDVSDVLGKVYEEALASAAHLPDEELRPWFYTAARHRAIDAIRRQEGEGAAKRSTVPIDETAELADERLDHDAVLDTEAALTDAVRVHRALEALPAAEREILRLSAVEGLSIRTTAELLGLSKKVVERTRARGLERFKALIGAPVDEACGRARALIEPGRLVDPQLARWRDAHLAGCIGCQVEGDRAYGKRLHCLAPLLPIAHPVASKLQSLLGKLGGLPPEAAAAGVSSGAGGAATLAGMVAGGAGAKVAAIGLTAAVCATAAPALSQPDREAPARAVTEATTPSLAPAPTWLPERVTHSVPAPAQAAASARRPGAERTRRRRTARRGKRRRPARPAQEWLRPAEALAPAAPTRAIAAPTRAIAAPSGAKSPPPAPSPSAGDAFAGEFSP